MKSSYEYPRLHGMRSVQVMIITVAEGKGTHDNPIHEVHYVAEHLADGGYEIIGELYETTQ